MWSIQCIKVANFERVSPVGAILHGDHPCFQMNSDMVSLCSTSYSVIEAVVERGGQPSWKSHPIMGIINFSITKWGVIVSQHLTVRSKLMTSTKHLMTVTSNLITFTTNLTNYIAIKLWLQLHMISRLNPSNHSSSKTCLSFAKACRSCLYNRKFRPAGRARAPAGESARVPGEMDRIPNLPLILFARGETWKVL